MEFCMACLSQNVWFYLLVVIIKCIQSQSQVGTQYPGIIILSNEQVCRTIFLEFIIICLVSSLVE